jgi:hypothetical protein
MRGHLEVPQNPLEAARPSRLPFYKYCTPVSPLEYALRQTHATVHSKALATSPKSFRMRTYAKTGGRGAHLFWPSLPVFTPRATWSYLQTGILARLKSFVSPSYENCCGVPSFFPSRNAAISATSFSSKGRPYKNRETRGLFLSFGSGLVGGGVLGRGFFGGGFGL